MPDRASITRWALPGPAGMAWTAGLSADACASMTARKCAPFAINASFDSGSLAHNAGASAQAAGLANIANRIHVRTFFTIATNLSQASMRKPPRAFGYSIIGGRKGRKSTSFFGLRTANI